MLLIDNASAIAEYYSEDSVHPYIPDEFESNTSGLKSVYGDLRTLCIQRSDRDSDDYVQPTEHALKRSYELLEKTAYAMMRNQSQGTDRTWDFPRGFVTTDDSGGIRIEWWHSRTNCVTLVVGHNIDAPSYVFVKLEPGHPGKMNKRVFPARLASQLHELNKMQMGAE